VRPIGADGPAVGQVGRSERAACWASAVIVVLYLALGVAFSVVNPLFESPDEALNYANVRFFAEERRLPTVEPDARSKAHHPPLYYVLGAAVSFWVPNERFEAVAARVNPFWAPRMYEPGVDNKNLYLHDPGLESFPYVDVALGVHLVRWLSLLMGAGVVLLVRATARELFPRAHSLAVGAAALVAFNPMFLFITASVHDDALANLVAAATLYVTARYLTRGPTAGRAAGLGLLLGLGALTKLTCLLVAPTVALAFLWWPLRRRDRRSWLEAARLGGIALALALLVGGWWFVRNVVLYGEPTSMGLQTEVWGLRYNAPDAVAALRELGFQHDSAWGVFGYGQIPLPGWTYGLVRVMGLAALGGVILFWARRRSGRVVWEQPPSLLLVVFSVLPVTYAVNFARMTVSAAADFGRYLFVALAVVAPLYVLGLSEWLPSRARWWAAATWAVALLALAVFALLGVLWPAYSPPAALTESEVGAISNPLGVEFGRVMRLLGYDLEEGTVEPGGEVELTLYWQALAPAAREVVVFVHLLGQEDLVVAQRDSYPGLGRLATSRLEPGFRWAERHVVSVPATAYTPDRAEVSVGLYDLASEERLPAVGGEGEVFGDQVRFGQVVLRREEGQLPSSTSANFGGRMALVGYELSGRAVQPGEAVTLTLYWRGLRPMDTDYTISAQLVDEAGRKAAQHDGWPQDGAAPTGRWEPGEAVADTRRLDVHPDALAGAYDVRLAVYVLEGGEIVHLPVLAQGGGRTADHVILTRVRVQR
jgi:4-amino-4-deoxy-L-arabinose transferase-like glycosyltransferase